MKLKIIFFLIISFIAQSGFSKNCSSSLTEINPYLHEPLRFMSYNILNLYLHLGKFKDIDGSGFTQITSQTNKPEHHVKNSARPILDFKPHILSLIEVEGHDSARQYNKYKLKNKYRIFYSVGNDFRGIGMAFFVDKKLPFDWEFITHRETLVYDPIKDREIKVFSRDLAQLVAWDPRNKSKGPLFSVFMTHKKSQRDRPNDPGSVVLRNLQLLTSLEIIENYRNQAEALYQKNIPIFYMGDFNGNLKQEKKAKLIKKFKLVDVFDHSRRRLSPKQRATYNWITDSGPEHVQFDYILGSPSLTPYILNTGVYRYRDENNKEKPLPRNREEKHENPSDHQPVFLEVAPEFLSI